MLKKYFRNEKNSPAQAMVEFALVLPILLLVVYGLLEAGRLLFMYASVTTASRQAVRYASATGENDSGIPRFMDCSGITAAANSVAFIADFETINITYDRPKRDNSGDIDPIRNMETDPSVANECPTLVTIPGDVIQNGDRVRVYVDAQYTPIVPLVPFDPLTITAESSRTILVTIPLEVTAQPASWLASTPTASETPTNTPVPPTSTFTPSYTPSPLTPVTPSRTKRPTNTPKKQTPTNTPLPPTKTFTPTVTNTPIVCNSFLLSNGPLVISDNKMSMTINNGTGYVLETSQIYVNWNTSGGEGGAALNLIDASLGGSFWSDPVGESGAPMVFTPSSSSTFSMPTIPTGSSSIEFTFDGIYQTRGDIESIIVYIGTSGCEDVILTGN